ncbi:solute carrier organic anion transporter family member 4A1-like isoform X2 [Bolinopsis microptera]|uniref:solute carrier organic anion transporter family member 4A1-like isoform X2 n=2 Tax=Bolinopsis microptera TaxID=2820187 RepID=UPI00307A2E55
MCYKGASGEAERDAQPKILIIANKNTVTDPDCEEMPEGADYKKLGAHESWDDTDRKITQMGYMGWRPRFLECLNKPAVFTSIFAVGNFFMVMSYGILSMIIPTLESVFNLNSKQTGVILMANDISGTVAALFIANYCSARKTRWIGIGMIVVVIATILPASVTLFAEYPLPRNRTEVSFNQTIRSDVESYGVCNESRSEYGIDESEGYAIRNHQYYWIFVFGALLQGFGAAPPGIAGSTYMDEIFTQKQFGVAISLLYVVSFIGYPISMLAGSVFLQYYVTFDPPEGVTFESKEWVGAWWMGMFFPAIAVFVLSFFVLLYPRQMPAAKKVLKDKVRRGITTVLEKKEELGRSLKEITLDMIPAFKRVFKNKALNCLIIGDVFLFLQIGAYSFYPKIYALIFRLDSKSVGSILGISNIIGFAVGLIAGGLLMRWRDWHPKTLQLLYSILTAAAVPFSLGMLLYCPVNTYAGVDLPYSEILNSSQLSPPSLTGECNADCACTTAFYQPVCDGNVTFFSPCHAGCMDVELVDGQVTSYTDCMCTKSGRTLPGECGSTCTTTMWLSLTLTTVGTIIGFSGFAAHAYIYQRIVNEVDRTFCQGIRSSIVRALGTMPAPLLFGWVIDSFCVVWRESEDGTVGNCWVYDVDRLLLWFTFLQMAMRTASCAFYFVCWYVWVYTDSEKTTKPAKLVGEEFQYTKHTDENGEDHCDIASKGPVNGQVEK